jgi:hypothetical protein
MRLSRTYAFALPLALACAMAISCSEGIDFGRPVPLPVAAPGPAPTLTTTQPPTRYTAPPSSGPDIELAESDPKIGQLDAELTIRSASSSTTTHLYWGDADRNRLGAIIVKLTAKGMETYSLKGKIPDGATYLLGYSVNPFGERETPTVVPIADGVERKVPIPVPSKGGPAAHPLIDGAHKRAIVPFRTATTSAFASQPGFTRCALDGTACTYRDAATGSHLTDPFQAAIDPLGERIFFAGRAAELSGVLRLVSCEIDGASCATLDVSTPFGAPSMVADSTTHTLFVVSRTAPLQVMRCPFDLSACDTIDVSPLIGAAPLSGNSPLIGVDPARAKVAIAFAPSLILCDAAFTACTTTVWKGPEVVFPRQMLFDEASGKILILAKDASESPLVYRCNADGSACGSTAAGPKFYGATMVLDPVGRKAHVLMTSSGFLIGTADAIFDVDGGPPTIRLLSNGQHGEHGGAFDPSTQELQALSHSGGSGDFYLLKAIGPF